MTDTLGYSESSPGNHPDGSSGKEAPVQTHNTPILPNPEQGIAVPNEDSSDTRDGYVNIQNLQDASTENTVPFPALVEAHDPAAKEKTHLRKRILATTAIAASVIVATGGILLSTSWPRQPEQPLNQAILTTASSTVPTATKSYVPRELMPAESQT